MVSATYFDTGSTTMLHNEEVNSIHGQSGHGVLQLLWCATVTWQAAHLEDNHHLVPETFQWLQGSHLQFSLAVLHC